MKGSSGMISWILGIGCCVQGLRCFPWMAVIYFLKDGLQVDPSTLQLLLSFSNLPMVGKPLYGILSDAVYIFGEHRLPYLAVGALLQAVSWFAVAVLSSSGISITTMTIYLLLGNLGASIAEVANDAIIAEAGKNRPNSQSSSSSGELQSFAWTVGSLGGVIGNLIGGVAIERYSPRTIFLIFGVIVSIQFLVTICVRERTLDLPDNNNSDGKRTGIRKQFSELAAALRNPKLSRSIAWFAASYAMIPVMTGTMFFYQTSSLGIDSSVIGISKVFGQAALLLWGVVYNKHLMKTVSARTLVSAIQATMAVLMVSDVLFVKGFYRNMGMSDSVYVVIFSGVLEVLFFCKILPFSVLVAQLCPPGCEGSLMAFVMSATSLAFIVGGFLGVGLSSYIGVTGDDFTGLPKGLLIQAFCTVVPLFWSSWIPDNVDTKEGGKKD